MYQEIYSAKVVLEHGKVELRTVYTNDRVHGRVGNYYNTRVPVRFCADRDLWLAEELFQSEQAMQALDEHLETSGEYCHVQGELGHMPGWYCSHPEHTEEYQAWAVLQEEDIDPRNQAEQEEFQKGLAFILDGEEPF